MLTGLVTLGFAILMLVIAGKIDAERTRKRAWPTVMGTILERGVGAPMSAAFGPGAHAPHVKYRYLVDGKEYVCETCYDVGVVGGMAAAVQRRVDALPDPIAVHYDPSAPGNAFVMHTGRWVYWTCIAGGMFAALAAGAQFLVAGTKLLDT